MDVKAGPTHAPRLYFDPDSGCWRRFHKTTSRTITMPSDGEKKSARGSKPKEKTAFERLPDEIIEQ
jgi:hypothetical protein